MAEVYHRKIELQSPDDLTYLVANIRRAADAEIEKALPKIHGQNGSDAGEGDMRDVVEQLVEEYIQQTLESLLPNLTINGLPPDEKLLRAATANKPVVKESIVFEPFNGKAEARSRDLMAQEDDLLEEILRLKREVPLKVVEHQRSTYKDVGEADEEAIKHLDEQVSERKTEGVVLDKEGEDRRGAVKTTWEKGVQSLERAVENGPSVVAKVDKTAKAEDYVRGMRS